jgi:hypothetical protein
MAFSPGQQISTTSVNDQQEMEQVPPCLVVQAMIELVKAW